MTDYTSMPTKRLFIYSFLFILLLCGCVMTLGNGEMAWNIVWDNAQLRLSGASVQWNPLLDERLPRLIVILCTGSSLAVSGVVMQSLFNNPLASPSVLGISSGGSLCIFFLFILGLQHSYPFALPIAAFSGCLFTLFVIYTLSRQNGKVHLNNLILTGIAISTLLLAVQGTITYAYRDHWQLIQTLTELEAGSTSDRTWQHVHMQLPLTIVGMLGCYLYRRELDILTLGEEEAMNLGVNVTKVRWRLFLCVSILIGGSIATLGAIAFFGLILPHLMRKIIGPGHMQLMPVNIIGGGVTLLLMDNFLRYFEIHAFSLGNLSAVLGSGFFVYLLITSSDTREAL